MSGECGRDAQDGYLIKSSDHRRLTMGRSPLNDRKVRRWHNDNPRRGVRRPWRRFVPEPIQMRALSRCPNPKPYVCLDARLPGPHSVQCARASRERVITAPLCKGQRPSLPTKLTNPGALAASLMISPRLKRARLRRAGFVLPLHCPHSCPWHSHSPGLYLLQSTIHT